jgi:hypothetical protein
MTEDTMQMKVRPATVVTIAFKSGGQVIINSVKSRESIKAQMKVPKDEEVSLASCSKAAVVGGTKNNPQIEYVLTNEEINFVRGDLAFWSVQDVEDPPKIDVIAGLITPEGKRLT